MSEARQRKTCRQTQNLNYLEGKEIGRREKKMKRRREKRKHDLQLHFWEFSLAIGFTHRSSRISSANFEFKIV
jgi:hypothetical protein